MGDNIPFIKESSVRTNKKGNGNLTALEQYALLTLIPAAVLISGYFLVRSSMTLAGFWDALTIMGVLLTIGLYAVLIRVRVVRWVSVPVDDMRRPKAAQFVGNAILNGWPLLLLVAYQAVIVDPLSLTLINQPVSVVAFILLVCASFALVPFCIRMITELLNPLYGDSIELAVRDKELRHDSKMKDKEIAKLKGQIEYAQKLEAENIRLKRELAIAVQGSRVIFANHGTARGDSTLRIDNNEMFNRFVYAAFGGEKRKRDEWSAFLIADPQTEIPEDGKRRYWEYRTILTTAGLWNMKTGPIKTLEEACEALRIPLPHSVTASAGGRAGVGSALAVPPDFDDRAGGSEDVGDEGEADDE